jgi:hypothetical protein
LLASGRRAARALGVVSQQRHQLEGSMERVSDSREVIDRQGRAKLGFDLSDNERRSRYRRAVKRCQPHDRRVIFRTRRTDGDRREVGGVHAVKIGAGGA